MAMCCMVTQAGDPCSRRVEYEGMVCRQHGVMLAKQGRAECEGTGESEGFWDYGDSAPASACRDRSADLEDDWVGVNAAVADLFDDNVDEWLPNYEESELAHKRGRVVRFADECGGSGLGWVRGTKSLDERALRVITKGETERERCSRLAQLAAIKGVEVDEMERIADGSGRWIWTVRKARGKTPPKGYFAQFRIDGRMAVRCECPGCAPKPRSKAKLCLRLVRTVDHCVKCTCAECVCPARILHGLESKRALTGWWDNPCGGKCGGCKRLATVHCAAGVRGWTE